ncbi:hypothetical protein HN011_009940 [Eciton burchellii]|nr:hypothetical protein HN011_009940 [Eciton burchellii]
MNLHRHYRKSKRRKIRKFRPKLVLQEAKILAPFISIRVEQLTREFRFLISNKPFNFGVSLDRRIRIGKIQPAKKKEALREALKRTIPRAGNYEKQIS